MYFIVMKPAIISVLMLLCTVSYGQWETDFSKAKSTAKAEHKLILLNFSGSDWCAPCIRLKNEIFDTPAFTDVAHISLILVNADFPRKKKNLPDKTLQLQNDNLAAEYNDMGKFPLTVLLTPDGVVLKRWEWYPQSGVDGFVEQIKKSYDEFHGK